MFLSWLLINTKQNYWLTELEIAEFVWVIKKIHYLVKLSKHKLMIQTDHSTIVNIVKQRSIISTTSTMWMNLKLVRASQFLYWFNLNIRHKPEKENIIPNTLSCLANTNIGKLPRDYNKLDTLATINI